LTEVERQLYDETMNWMNRFVAFDTETTGLDSKARILEIACVLFEDGEVREEWSTLLLPQDVDWNDKNVLSALEVNKIDIASLKGRPSFADVFHRLFVSLNSAPVWVAHNAEFDLRMFDQEYAQYKGGPFPIKPAAMCVCTKLLSRSLHPQEKSHRLQDTAPRWGVTQEGAHRAASDAITCGRILAQMANGHLPADLEQIHELQKQASSIGSRRGSR
jgi:DNA polymerase III epsilon subunit-like protein